MTSKAGLLSLRFFAIAAISMVLLGCSGPSAKQQVVDQIRKLRKASGELAKNEFECTLGEKGWMIKSNGRPVTAEVLRQIQVIHPFSLNLQGSPLEDDQLREINKLPTLAILNLADTGISDAGLLQMNDINYLSYLDLTNTRVTPEGLAKWIELRKANNRIYAPFRKAPALKGIAPAPAAETASSGA